MGGTTLRCGPLATIIAAGYCRTAYTNHSTDGHQSPETFWDGMEIVACALAVGWPSSSVGLLILVLWAGCPRVIVVWRNISTTPSSLFLGPRSYVFSAFSHSSILLYEYLSGYKYASSDV